MDKATVYLIPSALYENVVETIPPYVLDVLNKCTTFFVENEKTSRRFLKRIWHDMVIDNYEWHTIHKVENEIKKIFVTALQANKNIAILSECGCPAIADPGSILVAIAQEMGVQVKPFVGPNAITLALMASGMNGQRFAFHGYLSVDKFKRKRQIKNLEEDSKKNNCTQIFIETPYRNNQIFADILTTCNATTRCCLATDITAATEYIATKTILQWQQQTVDINKRPTIFLLQGC